MGSGSVEGRRLAILADGHLDLHFGKTTIGLLRYRPASVVAVIDRKNAGMTTGDALGVGGDIPIVASLPEAFRHGPDTLLIGVATRGGFIPDEWRTTIAEAISFRLNVISGLHEFVSDDPGLAAAARRAGVQIVDVRQPPSRLGVASSRPHRSQTTVITIMGSDCAVGKMSVGLDVEAEAKKRGVDAHFLATGQTGMMIAGNGIPLDRIIGDFMAGAIEKSVLEAAERHEVVLVEGQGSLLHPGYSGVTLALLHGSQPDGQILTIMPGRATIDDYEVPIPPALELIEIHEAAASWIKPAPVIAIAVNSLGFDDARARHIIDSISAETGLPSTDTFRFGAGPLVDAVQELHVSRAALR